MSFSTAPTSARTTEADDHLRAESARDSLQEVRRLDDDPRDESISLDLTRAGPVAILKARGLSGALSRCLEEVLRHAKPKGVTESEIDDVLMVGGSTLLPDVYSLFEARFGRAAGVHRRDSPRHVVSTRATRRWVASSHRSAPSDQRPRLEIGFCVNAECWLCATARDLRTGKSLVVEEPVVRLL